MAKGANVTPSVALPQGGGAMRGLGEKFSPDLFTGTGNLSVPIQVPQGRNELQPSLTLQYSTGGGSGLFGLGWSLSLPEVSRSTTRGLPRYSDENDIFVLSGMEDLVALPPDPAHPETRSYRPRTEGAFARIEHIRTSTDNYWKATTKEGLVSFYGTPRVHAGTVPADWLDPATVRDPEDPTKVFTWKLTRTVNLFGSQIEYAYQREQGSSGPHRWDVPLLQEIRYLDYGTPATPSFLVKLQFEYENRPDVSSAYRPGFETRQTKRCSRLLVKVNGNNQTIYTFTYKQTENRASILTSVQRQGVDASGATASLPPLSFEYTELTPNRQNLVPVEAPGLPVGALLLPQFDLVDVRGKGLPDVLELSGSVARYWPNQGGGRFGVPRTLPEVPVGLPLGAPGVHLLDSDGNGRLDLLVHTATQSGVYPMHAGGGWDARSFRLYKHAPSFVLKDPEVKLIDLDGDGATDAIRSEPGSFVCFFQDREEGWKEVRRIPRKTLDAFPDVSFSNPQIRWADMSGDGLQDLVWVRGRSLCYWPSLGRGRFGKRIEMSSPPQLPVDFDPRRILLGDVDGDGCADLIYVDDRRITLWLNQQGERFGSPIVIEGTPAVTNEDSVRLVDLLGTGTAGLLWVLALSTGSRPHLYFLDLTSGQKPYLLHRMDNHIGATTQVRYASSTQYYLADEKIPSQRWRSPLPFPVQVVTQTEAVDEVSGSRHLTEYTYHHGYWDGADREFRGFGRVDQRDTERFYDYYRQTGFDAVPSAYFSPPTETRSWFHQGPQGDEFGAWYEADYSAEYWAEDPCVLHRPASVEQLLARLPRRAQRDALRAMRGRTLRTELYVLDGSTRQARPFQVTEVSHGVSGLPGTRPASETLPATPGTLAADDWRLRVFFPFQLAQRSSVWERGTEPLTTFELSDRYDEFGQAQESLAIAVPRTRARSHQEFVSGDTSRYLSILTRTRYATSSTVYLAGRAAQVRAFEVVNSGEVSVPTLITTARTASADLDSGGSPSALKLLSETRSYYDGTAFVGRTLGELGAYGALVRTEELVMDEDQLQAAFGTDVPPFLNGGSKPAAWPQAYWDSVSSLAGYHKDGTKFFSDKTRVKYDFHDVAIANPRGLVLEAKDAVGRLTKASYDSAYSFFPIEITDPADLVTAVEHEIHFLQPKKITDSNGNATSATFTPLGLVKERFAKGKTTSEGDQTAPSESFVYDFASVPISVKSTKRQYHDGDGDPVIAAHKDDVIESVAYSDGFGRIVQARAQAEAGIYGQAPLGGAVLDPDVTNSAVTSDLVLSTSGQRVVVSEWKRYDNKGRVVETAEPYFASGLSYQAPAQYGAVQKSFYDPLGRVLRTVAADGSETRVVRGTPPVLAGAPVLTAPDAFSPSPWEVWSYDSNDNAGRDAAAASGDLAEDLSRGRIARSAFLSHLDTPSSLVVDALGRTISATQRLTSVSTGWLTETVKYDLLGNVLEHKDPYGRTVTSAVYDYVKRPLRASSLDAGNRWLVHDAAGMPVFSKDGRGALTLGKPDEAGRPHKTWACDKTGEAITLRVVLQYGDQDIPDAATRTARRNKNLLGRLMTQRDEAGLVLLDQYDFKGNVEKRTRKVIKDDAILDVFTGLPVMGSWAVSPYRVDWDKAMADADLDSTTYTTDAAFDSLGRLKWTQYPAPSGARPKLVPRFNRAGALEQLELDGSVLIEHIGYNAKGQRILLVSNCIDAMGTLQKRILTRYAHDTQTFRLLRQRSESCTRATDGKITPQGSPLQDTGYLYDRAGNIHKILERVANCGTSGTPNSLDRLFTYDALYRLLSATGRETEFLTAPVPAELLYDGSPWSQDITKAQAYKEEYTYDGVGFLEEFKRTSYTPAGTVAHTRTFAGFVPMGSTTRSSNRLASVTYPDPSPMPGMPLTASYTYDDAGHQLSEGSSRHMEWDHAGRLRSFRVQTSAASESTVYTHYLYDSAGQRVKKLTRKQGGTDWDVLIYIDGIYEHRVRVRGATTDEGQVLHVMDGQKRLGRRRLGEAFDGKPAELLVLSDHLDSANIELNWQSGVQVDREELRPYGETSFGSYVLKRYRFTGKERDEESGLYYHGARYFAPWMARWTSPDPAGKVDGSNLYAYVRGNPIRLIDPTGREGITVSQTANIPSTAQPTGSPSAQRDQGAIAQSNKQTGGSKTPAKGSDPKTVRLNATMVLGFLRDDLVSAGHGELVPYIRVEKDQQKREERLIFDPIPEGAMANGKKIEVPKFWSYLVTLSSDPAGALIDTGTVRYDAKGQPTLTLSDKQTTSALPDMKNVLGITIYNNVLFPLVKGDDPTASWRDSDGPSLAVLITNNPQGRGLLSSPRGVGNTIIHELILHIARAIKGEPASHLYPVKTPNMTDEDFMSQSVSKERNAAKRATAQLEREVLPLFAVEAEIDRYFHDPRRTL